MPAFIVSELRTAFEIGFLVFLPFLVIDIIVASILMSLRYDDAATCYDFTAHKINLFYHHRWMAFTHWESCPIL